MPNIEISKFKARRGTDAQRKTLVFEQGEFAYTTDTKRLYAGDGVSLGGNVIGNKIHPPLLNYSSLSNLNSQVGDVVSINNIFYQLIDTPYNNINNWEKFRLNVDPIIFKFSPSEVLAINTNSIPASYLNSNYISNGLKINAGVLETNFDTKSLEIVSYKLALKESGLDEREINSTTFINGISGGSGDKIGIKADPNHFYFDNDEMKLDGYNPFTLRFQDLNEDWFGSGLSYNTSVSSLSTTLTDVDNTSIVKDSSRVISIQNGVTPGVNELPSITVDEFGRVTDHTSSIFDVLTGNSALGSYNNTNSLSSIFNGNPSHSISGAIPGLQLTNFTALSSNGSTVSLSSAGFITFEGGIETRNGQMVGRFAIPIFTY